MSGKKNKGTEKHQGRGWHGDTKGHAKAGKKGGRVTYEQHGASFYQRIGSRGGSVSPGNFKNDPVRAAEAGSAGGKSKGG